MILETASLMLVKALKTRDESVKRILLHTPWCFNVFFLIEMKIEAENTKMVMASTFSDHCNDLPV
jgi:hypothetical protein